MTLAILNDFIIALGREKSRESTLLQIELVSFHKSIPICRKTKRQPMLQMEEATFSQQQPNREQGWQICNVRFLPVQ